MMSSPNISICHILPNHLGKKHFNIDLFKLESKQDQNFLGSRLVGRISDLMENETIHLEASVNIPDYLTPGDSHPLARENSHSRSTLLFKYILYCLIRNRVRRERGARGTPCLLPTQPQS